jgi:serine/threonine protein kinase
MWNRIRQLFGSPKSGREHVQAHMTFHQSTIGRSISRTGLLLKKQLWIWPILAVILLAIIGYAVNRAIRQTMENTLYSELDTLLNVERAMLEKWFKVQESSALTLANDPEIRKSVEGILAASGDPAHPGETDAAAKAGLPKLYAQLANELAPGMTAHDYVGFVLVDRNQRVAASTVQQMIGQTVPHQYQAFVKRTLEGKPTVSTPFASTVLLTDENGVSRSGVPTMFVAAPVRDDNFQVVAVLGLRIRPELEFTDILQLGRIGETGETYAVNKQGLLVSNSRFDSHLILLGLLPDQDGAASILNVQARNPGGKMVDGFRPTVRRREMPLTNIAEAVVSGGSGVMMEPYRDYRGSPSVGAYAWLPNSEMGIISEIDTDEAFRPLIILQRTFYALYTLLALGAIAIFVFTVIVARLQRQARVAAVEAKQLGQYRLLEKIGAGAMGVVYRGQHAMLRRPTAIKMLDVDRVSEGAIQRFEREVQITCNLNNPHTVSIYDYGRTPEGVFYYAMEFLDGIDLQKLVDEYGPQPEGRVVYILKQICASLYEAHSLGLVHRDIKPANIMINRRGSEPDVVKVLDFGLVKALDDNKGSEENQLSGTPLYMSPEAIQTPEMVDARSDLYAVGAVGYFMVTGQTAFNAQNLGELCQQHLTAIPDSPSERLGRAISPELEHAILACLEKNRAKRPQTARDLAALLDRVTATWTLDDAEGWWSRHDRGQQSQSVSASRSHAPGNGNLRGTRASGPEQTVAMPATPTPQTPTSKSPSSAAPSPGTGATGFDRTMDFNPSDDD